MCAYLGIRPESYRQELFSWFWFRNAVYSSLEVRLDLLSVLSPDSRHACVITLAPSRNLEPVNIIILYLSGLGSSASVRSETA